MITKINHELILFDLDKYNNTSKLYLSLWKKMYNIDLKQETLNIQNIKDYLHDKKKYI